MSRIFLYVGVAIIIAFLASQFPYALSSGDDKMQLVYLSLLLLVCTFFTRRIPLSQTLKYGLSWIVVFALIILGYSYRYEIMDSRLLVEIFPSHPRINADGNMTIHSSADGHFHIEAKINNVPVSFLIDTGASDIALSKQDAQRIGIDTSNLQYTRTYLTANGATGGAIVKLNRIQIGNVTLENFPASVTQGELQNSLLGMSALRKLGGFSINGDTMVIGH